MRSICISIAILLLFIFAAPAGAQGSRPLVVVLDPGHGGPYIGAASTDGSEVEKILTLRVAKLAGKDLRNMGYRVFLTRTRDQAVNTPPRDVNHDGMIDQSDDEVARAIFANKHHADVFVSIHFDGAAGAPQTHGTHGYYCPARPFWRKSRRLADLLTSHISNDLTRSGYRSPNNGVQTDVADIVPQKWANYPWFVVLGPSRPHEVIGSQMPGALIESLYLSSPRDVAALRHQRTIVALARGYADGIRAYFHGHTSS
ncbi:MAG: N-acetylmuramoyl-L-alanine amidase family protein [Chloroflexota bacterium]